MQEFMITTNLGLKTVKSIFKDSPLETDVPMRHNVNSEIIMAPI